MALQHHGPVGSEPPPWSRLQRFDPLAWIDRPLARLARALFWDWTSM
jgi:hypothetical protein